MTRDSSSCWDIVAVACCGVVDSTIVISESRLPLDNLKLCLLGRVDAKAVIIGTGSDGFSVTAGVLVATAEAVTLKSIGVLGFLPRLALIT